MSWQRFLIRKGCRAVMIKGYFFIAIFLLVNTANQIMFKTVALGPGGSNYFTLVFEPLFYLCGILFVAQAAAWLAVLRRLSLSHAYPFTSMTVITLLVSGAIFFGESISLGNLFGAVLIMAGVVVIAGGNNEVEGDGEDHL